MRGAGNHFASDLCMQLVGRPMPPWVSASGCGARARGGAAAARGGASRAQLRVVSEAGVSGLTVAITGATGFIGSRLAAKLASQGAKVRVLTTRDAAAAKAAVPIPGAEFFVPSQWAEGVAGADAVVNLAGTPIGTRWSAEIKKLIKTSRTDTTAKVAAAIAAAPEGRRPKVFVSSSAVGYYGTSQTASYTEDSPVGRDYLAEVCRDWEAAAAKVPAGVRVAIVRTGIVLDRGGGVLAKMLPIFSLFAGGPLGSGKQWMSWIHRDDIVDLIVEMIKNPAYEGAFNGTAPRPVTMGQFCFALGTAMGRPSWLPVPDFAITTLLGEGATVVLEGQQVLPSRAQAAGFKFKYPDLDTALTQIMGKP
ncbi:MAG: hypothetical protein J3K34DRAFT_517213 [Monoraphidium minutum]|nr:MAG: hypothetical protein J3K34DRAFT_517213 [Monoraphidium minutum]